MISGSFNGASIIALPAKPGLRTIEFTQQDIVGATTSPYSHQTQTQDWNMAYWQVSIGLARLSQVQMMPWSAFLAELRGRLNVTQLWHPMWAHPQGLGRGAPVCSGNNPSQAWVLNSSGWAKGMQGLLLPGDHLQIGYRLHLVTETVNADSNGNAAISIWPNIREAPAAGTAIIINNPKGVFRLMANKRKWTIDGKTRLTSIETMQFEEAL